MVADAFAFGVQVKSLRDSRVYLTDGIYGGLAEFTSMTIPRYRVFGPDGASRKGAERQVTVFGPTCDSIDRLPGTLAMPEDLDEGDWIVFGSMGAYLTGMTTRFNGYGQWDSVEVASV
jgi:ornithine decarboxylase